ncbi:MAG: hypothetical protein LBI96_05415 [Odoribacteraceae bacterium]|jgi:hypothetical protein|nr:hypothetical protein [Odoribacteraceae bacterium]
MKNKVFYFAVALALVACAKEESIQHYEGTENVYGDHTLPQGNHDYDAFIVDFLDKYNTLVLYKYVAHDVYWNVTNNVVRPVELDSVGNVAVVGYRYALADEDFIGEQLELIRQKFLRHYPDEFLAGMLPKKILLARSFVSVALTGVETNAAPFSGYDYLLFPYGGAEVQALTNAQVNDFRTRASEVFLRRLVNNGKIERDPVFLSISNYASPGSGNAARIVAGFITPSAITREDDWNAYVAAIVATPYDTLVAPRGTLPVTDFNRRGMLAPEYDTGGLIRKKYDAMVAYFRDVHDVDIQAIGNDFVQ